MPVGLLHGTNFKSHLGEIADVVAVDCMDGYAKLERGAQGG